MASPSRPLGGVRHDFAHRRIVRQHADDDVAIEQVGEIRRRFDTERRQLAHLLCAANMSNHSVAEGDEICRHRRAHATKADKSDPALHCHASDGRGLGMRFEGKGGVVLGHETPSA
jgi:hypothetical protein